MMKDGDKQSQRRRVCGILQPQSDHKIDGYIRRLCWPVHLAYRHYFTRLMKAGNRHPRGGECVENFNCALPLGTGVQDRVFGPLSRR